MLCLFIVSYPDSLVRNSTLTHTHSFLSFSLSLNKHLFNNVNNLEADESLALDPPPVDPAPASTTSTLMEEGGDEEEAASEEEKNGLKEEKNGPKDEEECLVMNSTTGVAAPAVVAGDMKNEEDLSVLVLIDDQQNDLDADIIGAAAAVPVTEEATGYITQVVVQEIAPVASTPAGSDKTPTTVKKIATATPVAGQAKIKIEGQEKNAVSLQQGAASGVKPAINTKTSTGAPATVTAAKTPATTNTGAATTTTTGNLASAAVNSTATVTEKSKRFVVTGTLMSDVGAPSYLTPLEDCSHYRVGLIRQLASLVD